MRTRLQHLDMGYIVALLLPLAGILPTLSSGIIRTADGPFHAQRIYTLTLYMQQGDWWPRWIPYYHLGYGYPIFNYYPPGVSQIGGLFGLLGVAPGLAFNLVVALAWMLGSVGIYALARRFLPAPGALLAVMLWAYAPSRLFEVWNQGNISQMVAAALLPWLLWGLVIAARTPSRRGVVAVALPLAGIILTHIPITVIAALFAGPLALLLLVSAGRPYLPRLLTVGGGLLLGAGLGAAFWLPLALELGYIAAATTPENTPAFLTSNMLPPHEVFRPLLPVDLTDIRVGVPATLGLVGGLLGLIGVVGLALRRRWGLLLVLLAGLSATIFMLLEISLPVWLTVPYLAQLRFPERFLRMGAVILALLGGASVLILPPRWRWTVAGAGMIAIFIAALPVLYPHRSFVHWPDMNAVDEIRLEYDERIWGTTSYDEYDPVWGERIPYDLPPNLDSYAANPLQIQVRELAGQVTREGPAAYTLTLDQPGPVIFRQYYFPGWTATVNGTPADIYAEATFGLLALDLPAGTHRVELAYTGTTAQHVGILVSLLSLGVVVALLLVRSHPVTAEAGPDRLGGRAAGLVSAAAVGVALVSTFIIGARTDWLRLQSPPDDPAYMDQPLHIDFGATFTLLGYTLHDTTIAPGVPLDVTLFWRATQPISGEFRPLVQLVNLNESEAWASSEPFLIGGVKDNPHPLDRFTSDLHRLRLRDDVPPYVGRIRVQLLDTTSGEALRMADGRDALLLDPLIRVDGVAVPSIAPETEYRFGDSIGLCAADVQREGDTYHVELCWQVLNTPSADWRVFVHGLDADGALITQADGPPLAGDYPSSLWQAGQTLPDAFSLPYDPAITQIAVGLYTPDGTRLPVTTSGGPVADDRVLLEVGG